MGINSITGPALQGLQKGFQDMRKVASDIASAQQTSPTDLSRALVELQQHANQTKAQVKTLKTANDILGTLIDERV